MGRLPKLRPREHRTQSAISRRLQPGLASGCDPGPLGRTQPRLLDSMWRCLQSCLLRVDAGYRLVQRRLCQTELAEGTGVCDWRVNLGRVSR